MRIAIAAFARWRASVNYRLAGDAELPLDIREFIARGDFWIDVWQWASVGTTWSELKARRFLQYASTISPRASSQALEPAGVSAPHPVGPAPAGDFPERRWM